MVPHAPVITETEVSIALLCLLYLTHYTAVQKQELFEKYLSNQDSHDGKYRQFPLRKGSHHMQPPNQRFSLSAKMNGMQRRTVVSP